MFTIVGVVGDVHVEGPGKSVPIEMYFPAAQARIFNVPPADLAVRAEGDPLQLVNAIENEVRALDQEQPVTNVRTMDEVLERSTSEARFNTLLLALFRGLALLLAGVGISGAVSYSVAQRAPEIGVCIAVGAGPADILRLVLRRITLLIAIGVVVAITAALVLTRFAESLLFNVTPRDPAVFAAATFVSIAAGLTAALIPARQATRVDPITVLRVD